jgi:hypothetical protein
MRSTTICALSIPLALTAAAAAQAFDLAWHTIDGGGSIGLGAAFFSLDASAGQPDAGAMSGGDFQLDSGFWPGVAPLPFCYANCDGSSIPPVLNVNDFICFQAKFAAGDTYANCDAGTTPPVLNVNDFICFQARFAAGCP